AQTILGAAVVDDVLGLVVLSVVVGTTAGRVSFVDLVILVTEAVGFLVVGMAIGIYVLRRVVARIHLEGNTLGVPLGGFLVAVAITFLSALSAGVVGNALFSMIVVVLILVTILPAPLFRRALKAVQAERHAAAGAPPLAETEPRHG